MLLDGRPIKVSNTCDFDAASEIATHAYRRCTRYANFVDSESNGDKFCKFISEYANTGVTAEIYRSRGSILSEIYEVKRGKINAFGTIKRLLDHCLRNNPTFTSEGRQVPAIELLDLNNDAEFSTAFQRSLDGFTRSTTMENVNEHLYIDVELYGRNRQKERSAYRISRS